MTKTLITLNTSVPTMPLPGSPVIMVFDNGDWEIGFAGDVNYVAEWSSNFFIAVPFADFFVDMMIFFDLGDVDDLDVSGDQTNLYISETVTVGSDDEPVLFIWDDREAEVMERRDAEMLVVQEEGINFIPVAEIVEDFRKFRAERDEEMFTRTEEDPLDADEDADPEDI